MSPGRSRRPVTVYAPAMRSVLPVLAALLVGVAPARAATEVTSGALTATVTEGAWHLRLSQRGGASLAETSAALASGPGRLGFRTAHGWRHATRILTSRGVGLGRAFILATNDPAGRRIAVAISPGPSGVLELHTRVTGPAGVTATGIGFGLPAGERMLGFGERSNAVDQRGRVVENYVSDGPFGPAEFVLGKATVPPWGIRQRADATYYPVPWLLSTRGYGVLDRDDVTSRFDLAGRRTWGVESDGAGLRLSFFAGPTPAGALARFTRVTGRQPAPGAPWAFGPWFQTGQPNIVPLKDEASFLAKLRAAHAPVSVAETQLRYLPCGLQRGHEAYERNRVAFFHRHGLAVLTYLNPMLCESYASVFGPAKAAGLLQTDASGQPFTFSGFVGGTGAAGFSIQRLAQFDWTNPRTAPFIARLLRSGPLAAGHDGWMEDFGEYTNPVGVRSHDGTPAAAMHNRYPATYHCAIARIVAGLPKGTRPLVRFQRSGWTGAARCASDVWGGDPATVFGFDGLSSAVKEALSIGLSGVSRWGSDIGGYDTLGGDPKLTPELLKRWIEFGAVSGVMRTKLSGLAIPAYTRPQIFDPGIVPVWRRYAGLHTRLYPYILAADAAYRATGIPLMRDLVLVHPAGPLREDEFGFGPDLLAAPVVTEGARRRPVYLPPGGWFPFTGSVAARARALTGGRTRSVAAPLGALPLFVRAGAVVPLLPADVSTLSSYGKGIVHLKDRLGALTLLAYPGPSRSARMFASEALRSRVTSAAWTLTVHGTRTRAYSLVAATAGLPFRPCSATLAGRRVPLFFTRRTEILRVPFRVRRGTLTVRPCR